MMCSCHLCKMLCCAKWPCSLPRLLFHSPMLRQRGGDPGSLVQMQQLKSQLEHVKAERDALQKQLLLPDAPPETASP